MYICIYVYVYIYVYAYIYTSVCVCVFVCARVRVYIYYGRPSEATCSLPFTVCPLTLVVARNPPRNDTIRAHTLNLYIYYIERFIFSEISNNTTHAQVPPAKHQIIYIHIYIYVLFI